MDEPNQKEQETLKQEVQELKTQLLMQNQKSLMKDPTEYRLAKLELMELIAKQLNSLNQQIYSFNELFAKTNKITTADEPAQTEQEQKVVPNPAVNI